MQMVRVLRLDPAGSRKTVEHQGLLEHWEGLGMPRLLFAGLYINGAFSRTSNAILKPKGHDVETGAGHTRNLIMVVYARVHGCVPDVCSNATCNVYTGLQACTLVPVIGNESVIIPWVGGLRER
jgi:hypothetical protein